MLENRILQTLKAKQLKKQKGASMMEYALLIAGIAIIAVVLFGTGEDDPGVVGTAIEDKVKEAIE